MATPRLAPLRTAQWVHLADPEPIDEPQQVSTNSKSDPVLGNWLSFYYQSGGTLPFSDDSFTFAFSEHFFEHLFLNEAGELFRECRRVLMPGACLRIAVPDADLRSYKPPEPAGYSTGDPRWYHPDKHKTRWSIYSLPWLLEQIGFRTRGIVYCDKFGRHVVRDVSVKDPFYSACLDTEMVIDTSYILRFHNS
ncbi:MAG: methyltransferase domain-containing protein, partial [Planctomycetaceae bacterium]|nr:methyltransferase domain-containing protein [Planctomycetaceae bacterium]